MRDSPGDRERAALILRTVLENQYRTPGPKWYGTFKRTPGDKEPSAGDAAFTSYDPNWRHFIGTVFELILIEYPDRVSKELAQQMETAIETIAGEMKDGRLKESYSNIALMYGALWEFAANQSNNTEWKRKAAAWNAEVFRLFKEHNTFFEYNAPTYYGVDLYGLGLWARYGATPATRQMGRSMQAALWRDIADFYNPLLRNMSGPYDRSYGMDMEKYVSVTGVWLRSVLPARQAPLPEQLSLKTDHVADLWFAPMVVLLQAELPADAMERFRAFAGPHAITRTIDGQRTATAWVGRDLLYGGEATSLTKDAGHETQFHPLTAQWRTPGGSIGWIRLTQSPDVNAVADRHGVTATLGSKGSLDFLIDAEGLSLSGVQSKTWQLPGLRVTVQSDGISTVQPQVAPNAEPAYAVHFRDARHVRLEFETLH